MRRNYNPNWRGGLARPRNNRRYGLPDGHYNPNQNYRCRGGGQHGNNCGCVYIYPPPICIWAMSPSPLPTRKAEPQPDPSTFDGMHINQMIEDCLIMMFRKFAIREQLRFRLVCQRWKDVLDRMFSNRKSIKLFGNTDDIITYCTAISKYNLHRNEDFILRLSRERNDELVIRRADEVLHAIPFFFPNLRRLLICHKQTGIEWYRVLPDVLTWLPHLESLTIFELDFSSDRRPELDRFRASQFWSSINHLYNLKELHLLDAWMVQIPFDMYVLNRLKQFTLTTHKFYTGACIQELSSNLQVLRLSNVNINNDQLRLCLDANPGMARNLRHLTFGHLWTNSNQSYMDLVGIICDYFKNLVTLDLLNVNMRFVDLITELSKLTALTDLTINLGNTNEVLFENAIMSPQLHSVKRLSVRESSLLTKDNFCNIFPRVFPFIESLRLDSLRTDAIDELLNCNLSNLFPNLVELKPVYTPIHDIARVREGDYAFAGRHRMQYIEHLCEAQPVISYDSEQDFLDGLDLM